MELLSIILQLVQQPPADNGGLLGLLGGASGAGGGIGAYLLSKYLIEKNEPKLADIKVELIEEINKKEVALKEQMLHDKNGGKAVAQSLQVQLEKLVSKEQYEKEQLWIKEEISKEHEQHEKDIDELKGVIKDLSDKVENGFEKLTPLINSES